MKRIYLSLEHVIEIHQRQIEVYGGAPGMRDAGLVETALLRPQTGYYDDVIEEAAALWESLTMNHGFIDGNKRIGFATTYVFLRLNGYLINATAPDTFKFVMVALQTKQFTKDRLNHWIRKNTIEKRVD